MNDRTILNPSLQRSQSDDQTVLNPSLQRSQSDDETVLNTAAIRAEGLHPGMKLKNGMTILEKMDVASGEADLYLCDHEGKKRVLKYYRQAQSLKKEVTKTLKSIHSQYVAQVFDVGIYLERNYEIDEYFPLGSLDGKKIPYEIIKNKIIPQLNDGLHALHQKKLLHKDLKPSNIMLRSQQYDIALIDFGISSLLENNNTVLMTQTGMTPQYAAPETMQGMFMEESDYYSLGITLCALFQGHSPFQGMDAQQISRFNAIRRLPLPEEMPTDLQNLILGLTYVDVTNRKDKRNPNRRWTYEEVIKWIAGEHQPVPGNPNGAFLQDAEFGGKCFPDQASLTEEMILQWDLGKKMLVHGDLAAMFRHCAPSSAPLCADAQEKAKAAGGYEDLAYFFLLYELMERKERFVWKGKSYENTVALGNDMLSRLQNGDNTDSYSYIVMLQEKILTAYAQINEIEDTPQMAAIHAAEESSRQPHLSPLAIKKLFYRIAYLLSGQKKLLIGKKSFFSVEELAAHMQSLSNQSFDSFQAFAHQLIHDDSSLDEQFEIWLEATGHQQAMEAWRQLLTQ